MAHVCICVVCGLPGAGKSTLVQAIHAQAQRESIVAHVIDYDALGVLPSFQEGMGEATWKERRGAVVSDLDGLVANLKSGPERHVVLLDDNMYYRSMRAEAVRVARRHECAYIQVYVAASVAVCIARDAQRPIGARVGNDVIQAMAARFQAPRPDTVSWEARTLAVEGDKMDRACVTATAHAVIQAAFRAMAEPMQTARVVDVEAIAEARAITTASLIHQADLALRRVAGDAIQEYRTRHAGATKEEMKTWAQRVNDHRSGILARYRRGVCLRGPACEGDLCDHGRENDISSCTGVFMELLDNELGLVHLSTH